MTVRHQLIHDRRADKASSTRYKYTHGHVPELATPGIVDDACRVYRRLVKCPAARTTLKAPAQPDLSAESAHPRVNAPSAIPNTCAPETLNQQHLDPTLPIPRDTPLIHLAGGQPITVQRRGIGRR
jgi:hypothetical protein